MDKLLRRVFPTRPLLGMTLVSVALLVLIAVGIKAVYAAGSLGKGRVYEGGWTLKQGGANDTSCAYRRDGDQFVANNPGLDIYNLGKQHRSLCYNDMPTDGICPLQPVTENCTGPVDMDHLGAKPMPSP